MRRTGERLLVALGFGCVAAVVAYAALRVVEHAFFPEPDPSMLIWSDRSRYAWRAAIALYAGGVGGFGGYALCVRAPATVAAWFFRTTVAAAVLLAAQAAVLP